ncbi:MAG TPA: SusC/RagA family TonB-linked outer membrane protein, partial [Flavisolibacter sp.]|nr:SusC/RagA family TonB-linked outer membrane protein [Flavisolibacter sp.]
MEKSVTMIAMHKKLAILAVSSLLMSQWAVAGPGEKPEPGIGQYGGATNSIHAAADIVVKGIVSSKEGPMAGVTVRVNGASKAVVTDANGSYSITAPEDGTLIFSFSGYREQRVAVRKQAIINVTLEAQVSQMDEVIVTGYRTQKRGAVIGAVTSVNSSEFSNTPVDNLSNALAGRLSGVTITQGAGTPGMESSIRIRAQGSLTGTTPLFVIDGVVSDKFAFDGLSPSEVQDVTILKDAASAAIYGARAANGVVLVTTKRGREGAPKMNYNGMYGIQSPTKVPETLNAYEHASIINQQLQYTNVPTSDPRYYTQDELDYFKTHSWNWIDEMWQNPATTQHSLDISGGSQNVKYFLGGSYNYATGSFVNINYKKFNLRGNVDVNVTKNLKVSLDLNTDTRNTFGPSWDVNNLRYEDLYKALLLRTAMVPPYIDGEPVGNFVEWHPGAVLNLEAGYNKRKWTSLNSTVTVNYIVPFIKGLTAKASFNRYNRDIYQKNFNLPYNMTQFNLTGGHNHIVGDSITGPKPRAATEYLNSRFDNFWSYQFNAQLNYKRNFGLHSIDLVGVYEQSENYSTNFNGQRNDFISSAVDQYIAGSPVNSSVGGNEVELGRLSYVGIASYNYAQKYMLEGSFRVDGSPIFAPEHRWGFFPALAAGWKVSAEPFFENVKFINDLKLRASVGLLGQDNIDPYQWVQTYAITNGAVFDNVSQGLEEGVLANREVTWEKARTYNVGMDSRFANNKMNFKLDVFKRHTYDIQGTRTGIVPNTFGATLGDENYREVDSKGFEIELGYNSQNNSKSGLNYYVRGNFGYSTNKVIRTNEAENIRPYLAQTGHNIGRIYGLIATGIIRTQADLDKLPAGYTIMGVAPQLGMMNYKDVRGVTGDAPDGKITAED